jgi:putative transposase
MPVRNSLKNGGIYHIYNRGINKCEIFHDHRGYSYFISLLDHCRQYATPLSTFHKSKNKPPKLEITDIPIDIHAYCIMPNHFHLLLQQRINDGISAYISRVCNGYTKGYNIRFERTGPLWEGRFKAKEIGDDSSYLQVIRYIHLNPVVSNRTKCINPLEYRYSSYADTVK